MRPEVPHELLDRARAWHELHRWERQELGKALRHLGLTYSEIRAIIPVPKSTLSYWCRSVELTDEQISAIRQRGYPQPGVARDTQRRRRLEIVEVRNAAARRASVLLSEPLFTAGVALYWAEGAKTQSDLAMVNSDPALLRLWIVWVRRYLDPDAEFSLRIHIHADNDELAARDFWRKQLGLPAASFTRSYVKADGTGHRKNHLAHGVCRVRVRRSANYWHMTMAWIECARENTLLEVATLASGR